MMALGMMGMGLAQSYLTKKGGAGPRINPKTGRPYTRRRRRTLNRAQMAELIEIRNVLGKTAAAERMAHYR